MNRAQWILWGACVGLEALVAVLAALAARRDRSHRPVVALFVAGVVADVAARALYALILEGAPKPLSAAWLDGRLSWDERGAYHAATTLVEGWPAWCCALAWWAFLGPQKTKGEDHPSPRACRDHGVNRTPQPSPDEGGVAPGACQPHAGPVAILAAWLAFSVAMAIAFPLPRGWTAPILHVAHVALAALSGLAVMLGFSRRREPAAVVASWLFAAQAPIALLGPFVRGRPWDTDGDWDLARVGYCAIFALLCIRYVFWLRSRQQENLR